MLKKIDLTESGALSGERAVGLKDWFLIPRRILLVSHRNPDGDAVGSALGLCGILSRMGHEALVALPDDSPSFLKWLPGHGEILIYERRTGKKAARQAFETAEMVICVDFNATDRLEPMDALLKEVKVPTLLIDHHPPQEIFTDYYWVDHSRGSTSELVYQFISALGWLDQMTPAVATCLLAGIMTDTVGLTVSCTYPEVFETVADLLRYGAEKERIYSEVYSMFSADRMKLLGYSLENRMRVFPDHHAAYIALTRDELNRFNHKKGDTEGFVNYPLSIRGIVFSVLFTEQDDHIKLSLRSKGHFPSNEVANRFFNGGGHVNAAGGRFYGSMPEALNHFESVLNEYKDLLRKS